MFGLMAGYGLLGMLAMVLFLTFAASGITWLVATVIPTTLAAGRRSVGTVAISSGLALAVVLLFGTLLFEPGGPQPGPRFRVPVQPVPAQPGQQQQPQPTR